MNLFSDMSLSISELIASARYIYQAFNINLTYVINIAFLTISLSNTFMRDA